MTSEFPAHFACNYQYLLNRLKLRGMQPKTIALYSRGVCRAGVFFDYRIDDLTRLQLTDYFVHIANSSENVVSDGVVAATATMKVGSGAEEGKQPPENREDQKDISIRKTRIETGLVQQTVQIVARFAITI